MRFHCQIILILALIICSCEPTDNNAYSYNQELRMVSIAYLRSLYDGNVSVVSENIAVEGYLVSSDSEGNFYHTMVFQDASGGIELAVDLDDSYQYYSMGDAYTICCQGLYLGTNGNNVKLGGYTGYYYVGEIEEDMLVSYISEQSSSGEQMCELQMLTLAEISDFYLSCYVCLYDVSYLEGRLYDKSGQSISLEVSEYASFYGLIPEGDCEVCGIIGKKDNEYFIQPSVSSDIIY